MPTVPETVTRPDPGLARGLWEATPAALYAALAVVLLVFLAFLFFRVRGRGVR